MNVFDVVASIRLDTKEYDSALNDESKKTQSFGKKIGGGLAKVGAAAGKAAIGAVAAGTTAVAALTKSAVGAYAQYEQLVGGVETLFGAQGMSIEEYAQSVGKTVGEVQAEYNSLQEAQEKVMANASNAYKTAGMSANEYMETVTSFAASLTSSLGGQTDIAADVANQAVTDMSDNANKMGTSIESIQNAYQGFAKQNYTMLDNLKLGYGGTKEEMERLLEDAEKLQKEKLGIDVDYDIESFADVIDAIHTVQDNLGITGTTAKEATETISGSLGQMKGAWDNLVTGMADKEADIDGLVQNLVNSIVGYTDESGKQVKGFLDNIIPVVETALNGVASLFSKLLPKLLENLPDTLNSVVPTLLDAVTNMIGIITGQLPGLISTFVPQILGAMMDVIDAVIPQIPTILDSLIKAFMEALGKIGGMLPELVPKLVDLVTGIADTLINNIDLIIDVGLKITLGLVDGILKAVPKLVAKIPEIITKLVNALLKSIPKIVDAGVKLLTSITNDLPKIINGITKALPDIIKGIVNALVENSPMIIEAGVKLFTALVENLPAIIENILTAIPEIIGAILGALAELSPELAALFEGAWELITAIWNVAVEFFSDIWEGIVGVFSGVGEWFSGIFQGAYDLVTGIWNAASDFFSGIWSGIQGALGGVIEWFSSIFQGAYDAVTGIWDAITGFFSGVWETIVGIFKDAGVAVGDAISGAVKGAVNAVLRGATNIINGFIKAINVAISVINAIPGVKISKLSLLDAPQLAQGGILKKGEIGLLEGTGAEAVVPLDQNKKWIRSVAQEFQAQGGGTLAGAGGDIVIPVYIGDERIQDVVVKAQQLAQYRTGGR